MADEKWNMDIADDYDSEESDGEGEDNGSLEFVDGCEAQDNNDIEDESDKSLGDQPGDYEPCGKPTFLNYNLFHSLNVIPLI